MSEIGSRCSKIMPHNLLSEEQALMYLKLRRHGCNQNVARKYCSKNVCQIDQTQAVLGPPNYKVIVPIPHRFSGNHGWEPSITIQYDMGDGYRLAKDLDIGESQIEKAVQQKYVERQAEYENKLRQKIQELKDYLNQAQNKQFVSRFSNKKQLLQHLRELSEDLRNQNDQPIKYLKHKGQKYLHIIEEVRREIESQGETIQEIKQEPKPIKIHRNKSQEAYPSSKFISLLSCEQSQDEHEYADNINNSEIKLKFTKNTTPSNKKKSLNFKKSLSLMRKPGHTESLETSPNQSPLRKKKGSLLTTNEKSNIKSEHFAVEEHMYPDMRDSIVEVYPRDESKRFETNIKPFTPIYDLNPKDLRIKVANKRYLQSPEIPYKSNQRALQQMNAESDLILNLLEQNGIIDSLDNNFGSKQTTNQPPEKLLNIIKQQSSKLKMAHEFNQTQYLFKLKDDTLSNNKRLHMVFQNLQRNGESINNIQLQKSHYVKNTVDRGRTTKNMTPDTNDKSVQISAANSQKKIEISDFQRELQNLFTKSDTRFQKGRSVCIDDRELMNIRQKIEADRQKLFKQAYQRHVGVKRV